jgi:poly(3-hydroxybutyrate) depolymerase
MYDEEMRRLLFCLLAACGDDGSATLDGGDGGSYDADGGTVIDGSSLPAVASAGCGMASTIPTGMWTKRTVDSGGPRDLWVWTPASYDPATPYPIVYELHGCSSSPNREANNVPVERNIGDKAILVRGRAAANCWDTATNGPDVPYWLAIVEDVEGAFCVDTARRFLTGYSSGAFMTHRLACIHGDKLRGVATIAGGQAGNNCTGNVGALLIHDLNDGTVNISQSENARNNHLTRNACTSPPASSPTANPPCVEYAGCATDKPVVWCQTTGKNHDRQDGLAAPIFAAFIESLF